MRTFTVSHPYPISEDRFWGEIFLALDYNTALYEEALGFRFEQLERLDGASEISRRIRCTPKLSLPKAAQKIVGDGNYVEAGRLDLATRRWRFELTPARLADKISIRGAMWSTPAGPDALIRHCETEIEIRILGLGKVIEKAVEGTFRESYDKAAAFTEGWLRRAG